MVQVVVSLVTGIGGLSRPSDLASKCFLTDRILAWRPSILRENVPELIERSDPKKQQRLTR